MFQGRERAQCVSVELKQGNRQALKIITVNVLAHFLDPAIKLSQKMIQLRQNKQPNGLTLSISVFLMISVTLFFCIFQV